MCVHGKRKRKRKRSTHLLLALSNVRGDGALHHISPVSEPQEDPARGRVQKEACVAVERGRTRLDLYTAGARGRERARAYVHAFTSCTPRQLLYVLNIFLDCQYNTSLTLLLICMCMHLHHVHIDNYCSHTCTRICSYTPHMYVRAYTRTHFCSRTHTYTHVQRTLTYKHVHTLAYIPAKNRLCGGPAPQSGTCTV